MDDNRLADVPSRHAGTERVDVSGDFMAERKRNRECARRGLKNTDI
jgi:hypothetical protein